MKDQRVIKKTGRPLKVIDLELLHSLAKIHCTHAEMASILNVSTDTLQNRFSAEIRKGFDEGKRSLRRLQWEQAEKGNIQMLIWLGKQMLGQKDKQPDEVPVTNFSIQLSEVPRPESKPIEINELPAKKLELLG